MSDFVDGFLADYFAECDEHLTTVRRALLTLEASVGQRRPDPSVTEELFRSFHSLKGISGMVEQRESELLAHEMESYLRAIREGEVRLTTNGIEILIAGARRLEETVAALRDKKEAPPIEDVLTGLRELVGHTEANPAGDVAAGSGNGADTPEWECLFTPSPELIARGVNVDVVRERLRTLGAIVSATPIVTERGVAFRFLFTGAFDPAALVPWEHDGMVFAPVRPPEQIPPIAPDEPERAIATLSRGHFVRVELTRLDELMRMIGDLVIRRARLAESLARIEAYVPQAEWRAIQDNATGFERELRSLREGVMRARLVRVGEIFRRMPFVVRDLARDTGRRVRVELSGQETEIDKFIVERMMDPVLHIVRNAVSHGIESVDERIAAGKPPEGTLSLKAAAAGELVTIEIADDGRGVDTERVLERARQAGLPVPAHADDAALLDLLCSPGFSTREESDRAAGRGFGMSVVRETVLELGGVMRMTSTPGAGTRFQIELPLTLAITDALIARIGSSTFAIPQAAVREVIEVDEATVRAVEGHEMTPYRGTSLPVVRLSAVLRLTPGATGRMHAFVIGAGTNAVALLVDRILGQREIVVRATEDPLIRVDGIAGATDLGDGRAVLILDVAAVARLARENRTRQQPARERA